MREQMLDRDEMPLRGIVRQIFRDRIGHRQPSFIRQQQNCRGGELFGHGSDAEDAFRAQRDAQLKSGETSRTAIQGLAVAHDDHRGARLVHDVCRLHDGFQVRADSIVRPGTLRSRQGRKEHGTSRQRRRQRANQ
jgi:hypothetical protein